MTSLRADSGGRFHPTMRFWHEVKAQSMCLAIPMQIKTILGFTAICEAKGVQREVNLFLLQGEPLEPGDHVLVHVGYALQKTTPEEASAVWALLHEVAAHA